MWHFFFPPFCFGSLSVLAAAAAGDATFFSDVCALSQLRDIAFFARYKSCFVMGFVFCCSSTEYFFPTVYFFSRFLLLCIIFATLASACIRQKKLATETRDGRFSIFCLGWNGEDIFLAEAERATKNDATENIFNLFAIMAVKTSPFDAPMNVTAQAQSKIIAICFLLFNSKSNL